MKRYFGFFILVIVFAMSSCIDNNAHVVGSTDTPITDSLRVKVGIQRIVHFEYEGHKYIDFQESSGAGSGAAAVHVHSIVHDPNCDCEK